MKVSESWLSEWVDTPLTTEALAEKLTMAGLEVDELSPAAGDFSGVFVAHVIETAAHPKADRLTVCTVDVGEAAPVQIVCGASNVRPNLKVALARIGAKLPGGLKIAKTKLRGELSEGMICSAPELGLEDTADGILELPEDAPVGMLLTDYLSLDDTILMIELTPNRADCFSMRGVAREVSALTNTPLMTPAISPVLATHDETTAVDVLEKKACPGYALRLIQDIDKTATTPLFMKERLRRAGIRTIHPAVDITQYVMLEFGQPMHAFDAAKVKGQVVVRLSQKGEQLTLLDAQTVTFDAGVLLIADSEKPLAIAGVMGGLDSAVGPETTDVLFESAFFEPKYIAGVARAHGLCTDASQRFERGVDPALHRDMIERATALLLEITKGAPGPVVWEHTADYLPNIHIAFNPARVLQLTGLSVPEAEMQTMLEGLGMQVSVARDTAWQVHVPSYRFDIALEVDLVEEIARLYGYDALKPTHTFGQLRRGEQSSFHAVSRAASAILSARGYHEMISYSFVDPLLQAAFSPEVEKLTLLNPLSSELSEMRVSLWPGLMAALLQNTSRQQSVVRCFETGVVFNVQQDELLEQHMLAGLIMGEAGALHWAEPTRAYDFYDLKGDVEALFAPHALPIRIESAAHPALHPGKSAAIYLGDVPVGMMGVLHPALSEDFSLPEEVMLFEVKLDALAPRDIKRYASISKYPKVRRDLSLLVDEKVQASQIEAITREAIAVGPNNLKAFYVFDQYTGEQVPKGKKSLAIALFFQEANRTLTEADITEFVTGVIKALEATLQAEVRDGG